MAKRKKRWRPFHKMIIDVIKRAGYQDTAVISWLLEGTEILANHDAINKAWKQYIADCYAQGGSCGEEGHEGTKSILAQKKAVQKKRRKNKKKKHVQDSTNNSEFNYWPPFSSSPF